MRPLPNEAGAGIVHWVIPPTKKPIREKNGHNITNPVYQNRRGTSNQSSNTGHNNLRSRVDSSGSYYPEDDESNYEHIIVKGSQVQVSSEASSIVINPALCRTICTFVEEHLKELSQRQQLIAKARSKLVNRNLHHHNQQQISSTADNPYIARNDISKLKVRDEQTKSIETIKQLSNYFKEVSSLQRQCDQARNQVDENIVNKLSDARMNIIQALNDFILSNSDIDIPILDSEDLNGDYDLLADAHVSLDRTWKPKSSEISRDDKDEQRLSRSERVLSNSDCENRQRVVGDSEPLKQIVLNSDALPIIDVERQRKEIQKLERDTVELRQLFSDFYQLVTVQGEQLNTIENNIVIATHRVSEGQHNLNKSMRSLNIIVPVTGCMAGALIGGPLGLVVGGKLCGITIGCATSLLGLLSSYTAQRRIAAHKIKADI